MVLIEMIALTSLAVLTGVSITSIICLESQQLRLTVADVEHRLREVAPYLGAAAVFFALKWLTQDYSLELSYALDWDVTDEIYALEGDFVPVVQDVVPDASLEFFSAMYMFGFPFLLVTALVLYFLLPTQRHLKELLVAYLFNYLLGTICYTLFIAYGPRNHLSSVDGLMYGFYPQTQEVTAVVSSNTNVFPSLHTSLAVIVLLFAWRSRREYPRWVPIAAGVAGCVVFSTMYLGIHWAVDVVAGIALGVGAVYAAELAVSRFEGDATRGSTAEEHDDGIRSDLGD